MMPQINNAHIWQEFQRHSRTFSMASRFLPSEIRMPVATLYLYCRQIDNIADELALTAGKEKALLALTEVAENVAAVFEGKPPRHPFWERLAEIHQRYELSSPPMFELIEGARWDLTDRRIDNEDDLLAYANLVAGCVGAMMLPFLAEEKEDRATLLPTARALGNAMQLTNIIRDVGDDFKSLRRIYIPATWMDDFEVTPSDLMGEDIPSGYPLLMERLMQMAEELYIEGFKGIHRLPRRVRGGIRMAARFYREIMNEVRRNGYNNLSKRAYVPKQRKMRLILDNDYYRRRDAMLPQNMHNRVYPPTLSMT